MAKRDAVQETLERLKSLEDGDPCSPETIAALRKALSSRAALVAGRAARIAGRHTLTALISDLSRAFDAFLSDPRHADRGCSAKLPIAEALDLLEHDDPGPFLAGVRHVQLEPGPRGEIDVAAPLRGRCVAALVRLRHPEAHREVARLLFDRWPEARFGAARAAGFDGGKEAELLLRARVHAGDPDPRILGACLSGLLSIAPSSSLEIVKGSLDSLDDEVAEQAALALAESRHPEALACLRDAWDRWPNESRRRGLLLPISLLRSDEAVAFLVDVVREGPTSLARETVRTLAVGLVRPEFLSIVRAAAESRGDPDLLRAFDRELGHGR